MTDATNTEDDFPLVSAIMLAGRMKIPDILAGIECFKAQTYPYKELIIVNNAKSQFEASELNIRAESNIFLVDTPNYLNAGMARNYGIRAANGQILAQFDADYWHDPKRLEAQIATIAENEAHICVLAETLFYSYVSGRAGIYTNEKKATLGTMVFVRPAKIDYPTADKNEEFGILDRMVSAGMKPIAMDKPELCCKLYLGEVIVEDGKKLPTVNNDGLTKKRLSLVKKIVKDRFQPEHEPESTPSDQKIEDVENPDPVTADT